jgi:hypothetical protein
LTLIDASPLGENKEEKYHALEGLKNTQLPKAIVGGLYRPNCLPARYGWLSDQPEYKQLLPPPELS